MPVPPSETRDIWLDVIEDLRFIRNAYIDRNNGVVPENVFLNCNSLASLYRALIDAAVYTKLAMAERADLVKDNDRLKGELATLRDAVRQHRDQKGDDRCWLDDLELYSVLPEGVAYADLSLHEPETMLANCKRFIENRQNPLCPYVSPQREIERLQAIVASLAARCAVQSEILTEQAEKPHHEEVPQVQNAPRDSIEPALLDDRKGG